MPKQTMTWFGFALIVVFVAGCASANNPGGGLTARAYVTQRPRVDQAMNGNAGYVMGTPPKSAEQPPADKTRDMFVFEVTNNPPAVPAPKPAKVKLPSYTAPQPAPEAQPVSIPPSLNAAPAASQAAVKYTVQKGDTLQKISKKFYHSYRHWIRIYDANKNVIKDPNRIKPGIVITIPPAE